MATYARTKWVARPELKQQLIAAAGSQRGFLLEAGVTLSAMPGGKTVSDVFLWKIVNGKQSAPMWMVIGLTRIAEDDLTMSRNDATAAATRWFDVQNGEGE